MYWVGDRKRICCIYNCCIKILFSVNDMISCVCLSLTDCSFVAAIWLHTQYIWTSAMLHDQPVWGCMTYTKIQLTFFKFSAIAGVCDMLQAAGYWWSGDAVLKTDDDATGKAKTMQIATSWKDHCPPLSLSVSLSMSAVNQQILNPGSVWCVWFYRCVVVSSIHCLHPWCKPPAS